ncbi:TauD/TfdA family dioxygenase [Burkholderia vietnamiensis]|uniref:TauD/TfdA family dioxygenase n=2 Tax=Burkholderia vietnamiensis TaxID=60552 RepID=UPI00075E2E00|nr:taurine catabolism dioxygenase TauD [Burkholderia vietnamiensis]KVE66414.1 taurine catabolism dioxygenase TauD [Burkholderia vietnamiensis]KVE95997.1 taurine catabolism dioxygenase TauD [Burkholderia vietnamiensis]KVG05804.1 taurine catabolism dioxygenase TauD [Burkholderia vietnamiensis]MBR7975374.1 TauD/TfdA family dioxygenase [Burkholderia vietnamiensis]
MMDVVDVVAARVQHKPLPRFGFELIESLEAGQKAIDLVDTDQLYEQLAHSGVVIFRNFADTLDDFNRFVSLHSARVTFDPARKTSTENTAEIDAGELEMGLHRENGNLPFTPDLQWFYCLEPARVGSETTICDGQRVLQELTPAVRRLFEQRQIKYSRRIPWPNVQRFLSVELQLPPHEVNDSHLEVVNQRVRGQHYRRLDQFLVSSERVTDAITTSCFSGRRAFCNSLLGPSVNYEPPLITWADGTDIDFEVWDEIKDVTARYTYDLFWNKGDVVVIDNSRVMHGRRRLADPGRRIFGAQSYRKGAIA